MLKSLISPIFVAMFAVASCSSVNPSAATFAGKIWEVVAINGAPTPEGQDYILEFTEDRVAGRFGCNQFGGAYEVRGEQLIARDIASTLMGCPEPSASYEAQGFAVLGQPMRMEWQSGRQLTLGNAEGSIALELRP